MARPGSRVDEILAALRKERGQRGTIIGPDNEGRVMITSRNQIWPPGQALDVPVLDVEVAADFAEAASIRAASGAASGRALPQAQ